MSTTDPYTNITRRQRARARYGGRRFASMANLPKEQAKQVCTCVGSCRGQLSLGDGWICALKVPASTDSLSPHEVLESPKTPWEYLLHLAIAAKARGIAFQLDGTRFYVVCSAIDWRFIEGEAVMS